MKKQKGYADTIRESCIAAGTYRPQFEATINALAELLEKRDEAERQYHEEFGGNPVILHTNSHGETNAAKNPAFQIWHDLTVTALSYWRELGLTPAGLKKINDGAMKQKKKSSLAEALKDIG